MPAVGLDHINVRTPDFHATVEFLHDALGGAVLHLSVPSSAVSTTEVLPSVR